MKKNVFILIILAFIASGCTAKKQAGKSKTGVQRVYSAASFDYSPLWLSFTNNYDEDNIYQGIIGDNYRRIQMVFLSVERLKNDFYLYNVTGKSKVNNTVCSFEGYFQIESVNTYSGKPGIPEAYSGSVQGKYVLWENRQGEHSGVFEGNFSTRFDVIEGYKESIRMNRGHSVSEGINEFVGTWTSYRTEETKKCNWGWHIPPNAKDLFRHRENEAYNFNYKYLDQGWESYVYGGGIFIVANFETGKDIEDECDDIDAIVERLEKFQDIEEQKWWLSE